MMFEYKKGIAPAIPFLMFINWSLWGSFIYVHFFPPAEMKPVNKRKRLIDSQMQAFAEPKKRRTGDRSEF